MKISVEPTSTDIKIPAIKASGDATLSTMDGLVFMRLSNGIAEFTIQMTVAEAGLWAKLLAEVANDCSREA